MLRYGVLAAGLAISLSLAAFSLGAGLAHPGGLAADVCHNDRKNGGHHCHRGPNAGNSTKPQRAMSGDVYYPNCTAARNAGAAPVRRGQPGHGAHLDRDGDGIGCE